jgi:hypothetical protein
MLHHVSVLLGPAALATLALSTIVFAGAIEIYEAGLALAPIFPAANFLAEVARFVLKV